MARSPRLRRRHDQRRDAILRAAARMFRERGFAETGMRDIAVAADLSPANLYHYFRGKDEILYYCQDRALDRMLAGVAEARRRAPEPGARLARVLRAHLLTMLDEVEGATAHVQVEALPAPLRSAIVGKRDRYERALRRLVEEGLVGTEMAGEDPAIVARAMLGALNWTVTWFRPDGPRSAADVADLMARFLVRGLGADGPVTAAATGGAATRSARDTRGTRKQAGDARALSRDAIVPREGGPSLPDRGTLRLVKGKAAKRTRR
ncbi:MAG: TetR/AcrR family transcriptional regulator [Vicinamibacterales bacterium]